MSKIFKSLDKILTTLKLNIVGEICRIRFFDGVYLNVDANRFGVRCNGKIDKVDDDTISIRFLSVPDKIKKWIGSRIEIGFKYQDEYYTFPSVILQHPKKEVIIIQKPYGVEKTQRRQYSRVLTRVPVKVKGIDGINVDWKLRGKAANKPLLTEDISGGGVRIERSNGTKKSLKFIAGRRMEKNSLVELEIRLPAVSGTIKAIGKTAWITQVKDKYQIGIRFLKVARNGQDSIVRYVNREKYKIKKEMGLSGN